jgi:hypothetical protein
MWNARDRWIPPEKREEYAEDGLPRIPRKRFRHARRYYRALRREAETLRVDIDGWFDNWHTHPDWAGDGNRGARDRRRHLAAGFTLFRRLLEQAGQARGPVQVFMLIDALDSSQDAVYVHTPNPNGDNFPMRYENAEWDVRVPVILRELLADADWELGRFPGWPAVYVVRSRSRERAVAAAAP